MASLVHNFENDHLNSKKIKLSQDHHSLTELDCSSVPKESFKSGDEIIASLDNKKNSIEIPQYSKLKAEDKRWESRPHFTLEGYKYKLIVRPNGLKYNEGYGQCIGIWFRPLPSDKDDFLLWPAKVKFSLRIESTYSAFEKDLTIPMKNYTWGRHTTNFRYPAFNFSLSAIKHSTIEEAQCLDKKKDKLYIIIEELGSDELMC